METVVIFNIGMDAAKAGIPRVAPETVQYPIVSRYVDYHHETVNLCKFMQRQWLAGWDNWHKKYGANN